MLKALKRIIAWTGPMKKQLFLGCVCSFFMTWAGALPVFIAAWMLSIIVDSAKGGVALNPSLPWIALGGIAVAILLRFVFSYGKNRLQESIGYEIAAKDRIEIGEQLKTVPLGYFSKVKTGDILATATTELGTLELQGMKMVDAVINGYIAVFAIISFLAVMSPLAAAIALAGVALSALALRGINRKSARLTPVAHVATEHLAGTIVEYVRGLATAKSYGRENTAMKPMNEAIDDLSQKRIDIEFGFTPLNVAHLCAIKVASVGVVAVAAFATFAGQMELWVFISLALFSFTIFAGVENVNDSAHMLGDLNDILSRLEQLKCAPRIDESGQDIKLASTDIEFDHVDFSYEQDGKQILRRQPLYPRRLHMCSRGAERCREDDHRQSDGALLRCRWRMHPRGRARRARAYLRQPARELRHGVSERLSLRRYSGSEHRIRASGRHAGGDRRSSKTRMLLRLHHGTPPRF